MPASGKNFRIPVALIVIDLVATLMILAGGFTLAGADIPGPLDSSLMGHGWTLVISGAALMFIAAAIFVSRLIAGRRGSPAPESPTVIQTVERRAR